MKIKQFVFLAAIVGYAHQTYALSERNVKILTAASGVGAATLSSMILHALWLTKSDHSTIQKIGIDALAMLVSGGTASGIVYYFLRQCTPEYKIALAESIEKSVKQDHFYGGMELRSSDDLVAVSTLLFGPHNPLVSAQDHISVLIRKLDAASLLVTEAFEEIRNEQGGLQEKCIELVRELAEMKNKLIYMASVPSRNLERQQTKYVELQRKAEMADSTRPVKVVII